MQGAGREEDLHFSDIYNCHQLLSLISGRQENGSFQKDWRVTQEYKSLQQRLEETLKSIDKDMSVLYPTNHPLAAIFSFPSPKDYFDKSKKLLTAYLDFIEISKAMHKIIKENIRKPFVLQDAFIEALLTPAKNKPLLIKPWEFGDFSKVSHMTDPQGRVTVVTSKNADNVFTHSAVVPNSVRLPALRYQQEAMNIFSKHLAFLMKEAKPTLTTLVSMERGNQAMTRNCKFLGPYIRFYTAVLSNNLRTFNHLRSSLAIEHTLRQI